MNSRQPTVRFEGNFVYKQGTAQGLSVEKLKIESIGPVAAASDSFVTPTVVSLESSTELKMLRLDGYTSLRTIAGANAEELAWFRIAGETLHQIHASLQLGSEHRVALPENLRFAGDEVWLHGDYTKANVGICTDGGERKLAVLDWRMTDIYGGAATVGTPLFDVAWFVSGLFMERPDRHFGSWNLAEKADAFVAGYRDKSPDFDGAALHHYLGQLYKVREIELQRRSLRRRVGLGIGMRRWLQWIARQEH